MRLRRAACARISPEKQKETAASVRVLAAVSSSMAFRREKYIGDWKDPFCNSDTIRDFLPNYDVIVN